MKKKLKEAIHRYHDRLDEAKGDLRHIKSLGGNAALELILEQEIDECNQALAHMVGKLELELTPYY